MRAFAYSFCAWIIIIIVSSALYSFISVHLLNLRGAYEDFWGILVLAAIVAFIQLIYLPFFLFILFQWHDMLNQMMKKSSTLVVAFTGISTFANLITREIGYNVSEAVFLFVVTNSICTALISFLFLKKFTSI